MTKMFDSILSPLNTEKFYKEHYLLQKPLIIKNKPDKFKNLFNWNIFNETLTTSLIQADYFNMFRDQKFIEQQYNIREIMENCKNGATLRVKKLELINSELKKIISQLSNEINAKIVVNLYTSFPGIQGLPTHYEGYNLLIFHIAGKKKWEIYKDAEKDSIVDLVPENNYMKPKHEDLEEYVTEPGDVFFIPRGYWHGAKALEPSLHLTLGIYFPRYIDYLVWLSYELENDYTLKNDLLVMFQDYIADNNSKLLSFNKGDFSGKLKEYLKKKLKENNNYGIDYQLFNLKESQKDRYFNFPNNFETIDLNRLKEINFHVNGSEESIVKKYGKNTLDIYIHKRKLMFDISFEKVIDYIFSKQRFSGNQLINNFQEFSNENLVLIVNELLKIGMLFISYQN